eukprot:Unigene16366_Nuclearia_a/m.48501 Unigene16366_Nuclearia_a/g.48501  ORF Unigene16366_Nuclearia_a/g.48501 Unigene16366_Nuclearia_a/m.48501 type:complete len:304 (-) Unigene16366_Nuclearia_a:358-1269(-)
MPQRLRRRLGSFSPGPDARFISIDGFQVHFEHHRPTAPAGGGVHLAPFLCLHGFGGSTYTWRNLVPRFCDLGAHVYCLDRLGFGLSRGAAVGTKDAFRNQRRVMPYSHQYAADAVLKFMDRLGLARVLLVGHSIGCLTAMMVALGHPERVAGLVLFAPAVFIGGAPFGLRRVLNTPLMNTIMPVTAKFMMERFTGAARARTARHVRLARAARRRHGQHDVLQQVGCHSRRRRRLRRPPCAQLAAAVLGRVQGRHQRARLAHARGARPRARVGADCRRQPGQRRPAAALPAPAARAAPRDAAPV